MSTLKCYVKLFERHQIAASLGSPSLSWVYYIKRLQKSKTLKRTLPSSIDSSQSLKRNMKTQKLLLLKLAFRWIGQIQFTRSFKFWLVSRDLIPSKKLRMIFSKRKPLKLSYRKFNLHLSKFASSGSRYLWWWLTSTKITLTRQWVWFKRWRKVWMRVSNGLRMPWNTTWENSRWLRKSIVLKRGLMRETQ